jgi:ABC-type uncharacterized transport system substrate-binding protein
MRTGIMFLLAVLAIGILTYFSSSKKPVIALVYAPDSAYHSRAAEVIREECKKRFPNHIVREFSPLKINDATSGRMAARTALDVCYKKEGAICITVGALCTQRVLSEAERIQQTTPVVFVGVGDPDKRGFVKSLDEPGGFTTGTFSFDVNALSSADLIPLLFPRAKHVLLPYVYCPDWQLEEEWAQKTEQELERYGCKSRLVLVSDENDALMRIKFLIKGCDAMTVWEGTRLSPVTSGISKIAWRNQIPFLDTQIENRTGSPFVYGVDPAVPTRAACDVVEEILGGKDPATIPVRRAFGARRLFINRAMCHACNISDDDIDQICRRIESDERFVALRGCVEFVESRGWQ